MHIIRGSLASAETFELRSGLGQIFDLHWIERRQGRFSIRKSESGRIKPLPIPARARHIPASNADTWMISPDSLQLRRTAIAYLYQNVIGLERADSLAFYDEVNKEGVEFPEMQQLQRELVLLRRSTPDQLSEARVGAMEVAPAPGVPTIPAAFRFFFGEQGGGKPFKFFRDSADTIFESFQHVWGGRVGRLQLVEVNCIATVAVNDTGGAAGFLRDRVMHSDGTMQKHLGREFGHFLVKLGSGMVVVRGPEASEQAIPGAMLDLQLESHLQDPRLLVISLLVKWPLVQLRLSDVQVPPELRSSLGNRDFLELNVEAKQPNVYLDPVYTYLSKHVVSFLSAAAR